MCSGVVPAKPRQLGSAPALVNVTTTSLFPDCDAQRRGVNMRRSRTSEINVNNQLKLDKNTIRATMSSNSEQFCYFSDFLDLKASIYCENLLVGIKWQYMHAKTHRLSRSRRAAERVGLRCVLLTKQRSAVLSCLPRRSRSDYYEQKNSECTN